MVDDKAIMYQALEDVLQMAYLRASEGKGFIRHGENKAYQDQDICEELRVFGINPALVQIRKKSKEVIRLETNEAQINELLDVMCYAAGAIIVIQERD